MPRRYASVLAVLGLLVVIMLTVALPELPEPAPRHRGPQQLAPTQDGRRAVGPAVAQERGFVDRDWSPDSAGEARDAEFDVPLMLRARRVPTSVPRADLREAPWSDDRLLADPTHMNDQYLQLVANPSTGDLYCVFEAYDLGSSDRDIHIARSTDDGGTWTVTELPSSSSDEFQPDLAIDDAGYVHVVWARADGMLMRARSAVPGDVQNWAFVREFVVGEPVAVPSIAVSGSGDFARVFIACAWYTVNWDWYQYEYTLLWMYSTNGGQTLGYDYLQPDGAQDLWPDVVISGGTVTMINGEQDPYTGRIRILAAADAYSGTFVDYVDLTQTSPMSHGYPSVASDGEKIYMAWQLDWDDGLGNVDGDVMYAFSWDGMTTVYGPYDLMATVTESVGPQLFARDGLVGCLWLEAPAGGDEFHLAARLAGLDGHPDYWGDMETVTDMPTVVPQFRAVAGCVGDGDIHTAWVDRRDYNVQGFNIYTAERGRRADLEPFMPDQWESPLVVNMTAGQRTDGILAAGFPAYVSLATINLGLDDAAGPVVTDLRLDGELIGSWEVTAGLPVATYATVEDWPLDLTAGAHTLSLHIDPDNLVRESDETDNELVRDLWVVSGDPQLVLSPASVRFDVDAPLPGAPLMQPVGGPRLDPRLADAMQRAESSRWRVVVTPAERPDPAWLAGLGRKTAIAALKDHAASVAAHLSARTSAPMASLWLSGELVGELSEGDIAALLDDPAVGRVWLDDRLSEPFGGPVAPALDHAAMTPRSESAGDPADRATWPQEMVGATDAWAQGLDGGGILVGHTDSGVAWDHPDFAGRLWDGGSEYPHHGWDCLDEDNDPYDPGDGDFWHGTHTAGLIVGASTGTAPGATLLVTRCVPGYYNDMVEALQFCLDNGCRLISTSAGWTAPGDALRSANRLNAEILLSLDVAWIVAAGNGDNYGGHMTVPDDISSPGDAPHPVYGDGGHSAVISVGAVTEWTQVWSSSSRGPAHWDIAGDAGHDDYPYPPGLVKPDIMAPGSEVNSTIGGGRYAEYSGTSMATPVLAGCAAVLLQANPTATVAELATALEATAVDMGAAGRDSDTGAGLVDLPAAVAAMPASHAGFVTVHNTGPVPLIISGVQHDASWLTVTPTAATVAPGDSLRVSLSWDAGGLGEGGYFTDVRFLSNDPDGAAHLPVALVVGQPVAVDDAPPAAPAAVRCYPNPFNPRTTVAFDMPAAGRASLRIYDARGRLVRELLRGELPAGGHEAPWDGCDQAGRGCAAGLYLARLDAGGRTVTGRMVLVR